MSTKIAAYGLSADPITLGHVNVIERMAKVFDKVCIIIATNPSKVSLFTLKEKEETVKEAVSHLLNVTVHICTGQYLVTYAKELGATVVVRGLRNGKDFEEEETLAHENRSICVDVETMWVPCLSELRHISSSVVKAHLGAGKGWEKQVQRLVTPSVLTLLKSKYVQKKAYFHWKSLMEDIGNPEGNEEVFKNLVERYSENHRFYHVLEHVVSMLDEFEKVAHLVENPTSVKFSIWYHDAVYDTERSLLHIASNEERSAHLAEEDLRKLGVSEGVIRNVTLMIPLTNHMQYAYDVDTQILLDLDLVILGRNEEEFDEFGQNIRKEHSFVPEDAYRKGRADILQMFFNREKIYFTTVLAEKYEAQARKNLMRAIAGLEA